MLSPHLVRRVVLVVCAAGIIGMIVGSIADRTGVAISFGIMTALAVLGLILVTSVAGPEAFGGSRAIPEREAAAVDIAIDELVAAGADEEQVRELVRRSLVLGRRLGPGTNSGR
ncbi:MAG: MFS transporter [Actinomycetia bacterium]|nr:MFS transporter [Actinomycetes bacterium]